MQGKNYKEITPNFAGVDQSIKQGTADAVNKVRSDSEVTQQNISNAFSVIQNLASTAKSSQDINKKANNETLMSGQSALTNLGLKYQTEALEIDNAKISQEEKLKQKISLQDKYSSDSKQVLESVKNNKALFSSILGTEESFNTAVDNLSQRQEGLQLSIREESQKAKRELENEVVMANINNSFQHINSSKNAFEMDKNSSSVYKNINDALANGNISSKVAQAYYSKLSEKYNNHSIDVFLDNLQTGVSLGKISQEEALNQIKKEFILSTQGKNFNKSFNGVSQVDRLKANEKLRKFLASTETQEITKSVVGYNITYDEAVREIESKKCDLGDIECNKIRAEQKKIIGEQISRRDDSTNAEYTKEIMQQKLTSGEQTFINKDGVEVFLNIDDPKIVNEWQISSGKGYYSSLDKGQINSFQVSYDNIYNTGKPADILINYNQWVSERVNELGSLENVEKEAQYHLSNEAYTMLKMYKNNNGQLSTDKYKTLSNLIEAEKQIKNGNKPKPVEQSSKEMQEKFNKTDYAKWLMSTGQWEEYNKVYDGIKNLVLSSNPKSKGKEIPALVKEISGNIDFIESDGVAISFDSSKYNDKNAIKTKINATKNRPELIENFVLKTAKDNVIDGSNSFHFKGSDNKIIMYTIGDYTGGKTAIAEFTIDDLLSMKTEFEKENKLINPRFFNTDFNRP